MDAAVRCVRRHGFEKTSIADIAAEAGVTRPTVYLYFKSRETVLGAAMLHAARDLAARLVRHVRRFDDPHEQVVENLLFCLREFGRYPSLALVMEERSFDLGARSSLSPQGLEIARRGLEPLLERRPELAGQADELAEVMVRFFLSLLTIDGPRRRSDAEMRRFLHRRLVPALGLDAPVRRRTRPGGQAGRRASA